MPTLPSFSFPPVQSFLRFLWLATLAAHFLLFPFQNPPLFLKKMSSTYPIKPFPKVLIGYVPTFDLASGTIRRVDWFP